MALVSTVNVCSMLELPSLDHGMDCIDEAVLGYRVEEADEVIVGRVEVDVSGCLGEVAMEVAPQLWDRQLPWMLWEKVLQHDVECSTGGA